MLGLAATLEELPRAPSVRRDRVIATRAGKAEACAPVEVSARASTLVELADAGAFPGVLAARENVAEERASTGPVRVAHALVERHERATVVLPDVVIRDPATRAVIPSLAAAAKELDRVEHVALRAAASAEELPGGQTRRTVLRSAPAHRRCEASLIVGAGLLREHMCSDSPTGVHHAAPAGRVEKLERSRRLVRDLFTLEEKDAQCVAGRLITGSTFVVEVHHDEGGLFGVVEIARDDVRTRERMTTTTPHGRGGGRRRRRATTTGDDHSQNRDDSKTHGPRL